MQAVETMRSFSSAGVTGRVSNGADSFAAWAPETVTPARIGADARVRDFSEEEVEEAVELAVAEAVAAANAEAEDRLAELRAELDAEREQAIREARQQGYEEGREEGERGEGARLRTAVNAAEEALDALRAGEVRWTGTIEENVCALAVVIARQIVGRELKADIEPVADLVRNALEEFPIDQPIRIRIHPNDLSALGSVGVEEGDPLKKITEDRTARWLSDSSITPGGCIVEGRERIIDGRVDTALERIYRRLTYTNA